MNSDLDMLDEVGLALARGRSIVRLAQNTDAMNINGLKPALQVADEELEKAEKLLRAWWDEHRPTSSPPSSGERAQ